MTQYGGGSHSDDKESFKELEESRAENCAKL